MRTSLESSFGKDAAQELTGRPLGSTAVVTLSFSAPSVDWSRYHLQLLFVDRTDTLRARVAAGIFDRIAEWNGYGRAMYSWTSGLEAVPPPPPPHPLHRHQASFPPQLPPPQHLQPKPTWPGVSPGAGGSGLDDRAPSSTSSSSSLAPSSTSQPSSSSTSASSASVSSSTPPLHHAAAPAAAAAGGQGVDASRTAAVVSAAATLKLGLREMSRQPERFEVEDLDRYDLVLCLDRSIRQSILDQVPLEYKAYYEEKVCLLSSFSRYECESTVMAGGGFALLPMQLSFLLRTAQDASGFKCTDDIKSPQLSGSSSVAEWDSMVTSLIWSTAGLAKYLMDAMPEDTVDPQDA